MASYLPGKAPPVLGIEISETQNRPTYMRTFSPLKVTVNFPKDGLGSSSGGMDYIRGALLKAVPNSERCGSCRVGGEYIRENVNGSSTDPRTRFSITGTSEGDRDKVIITCEHIPPDLALRYLGSFLGGLETDHGNKIPITGRNLLGGKT
ncbi:MAG: hypothetical protein JW727_00590 [Candidatus Aenigmarchaeota archaeon]|nr:hypothetical protein [Candidatus Aenigmarchaeota archaeon]